MGRMLKVLAATPRRGALLCMKLATTLFAALTAFSARAAEEAVDGYTWTYRINGNTAEIYGNGLWWWLDGGTPAIAPSPTGTLAIPSSLGGKRVTEMRRRKASAEDTDARHGRTMTGFPFLRFVSEGR